MGQHEVEQFATKARQAEGQTYLVNLTVEDLAEEYRTTPETVHYWVKVGKAPKSFKVGRRRLFARADVDAWAEAAKSLPA